VYFVNSGSEANDFAIFLARLHTGNFDIISFRNGYHGMSSLTMALTAQSSWRNNLPLPAGFHHVSNTLNLTLNGAIPVVYVSNRMR
jgi:alanine-glyoxylate transaminase/(R)-3-amino-2-methylpropionate-pyruvate transaminase